MQNILVEKEALAEGYDACSYILIGFGFVFTILLFPITIWFSLIVVKGIACTCKLYNFTNCKRIKMY